MTRFQFLVGIVFMMPYCIGQTVRAQNDCDFSNYRFGQISDWLEGAAIHKVTPEYPAKHKANGVAETVRIRILVDKQGRVVRTCPLYVPGEPKPDPVLVAAAQAAARKWRFQPNFGQPPHVRFRKFNYVRDVIVFRFDPPKG